MIPQLMSMLRVGPFFSNVLEMTMYHLLLLVVFREPTRIVLETMNEVFSPPMVHPEMEVTGVSITLLQIGDSGVLPLPRFLKHSPRDDSSL